MCIDGARPADTGHWRYYSDESLCFTRLVFMHEFDPATAPSAAWGLMAEIPQAAELPSMPADDLIARVVEDARRVGAIPRGQRLLATRAWCVDPAYVVFGKDTEQLVAAARAWLEAQGIHLLGRYGRWEYSSMAQVMRDGFELAARLKRGS